MPNRYLIEAPTIPVDLAAIRLVKADDPHAIDVETIDRWHDVSRDDDIELESQTTNGFAYTADEIAEAYDSRLYETCLTNGVEGLVLWIVTDGSRCAVEAMIMEQNEAVLNELGRYRESMFGWKRVHLTPTDEQIERRQRVGHIDHVPIADVVSLREPMSEGEYVAAVMGRLWNGGRGEERRAG